MKISSCAEITSANPQERLAAVLVGKRLFGSVSVMLAIFVFGMGQMVSFAADPPPAPSKASTVGQAVTNPKTGAATTVTALFTDPAGTPSAGTVAFVRTADGCTFLVKVVGEKIYNSDSPPLAFTIATEAGGTVQISADSSSTGATAPLDRNLTNANYDAQFNPTTDPSVTTPPITANGASGVRNVRTGAGGSNGRAGALFVPPGGSGNGATGPGVTVNNFTVVGPTSNEGIEAGSIGGQGGKGGSSYLSVWSPTGGGNGGSGGSVSVTNNVGIQVATTGSLNHGIYAYSRGGQAGAGGDAVAAVGSGDGGNASNGGNVTVNNLGNVSTTGRGAFGIYGLSVSGNGGTGGDSWGIAGSSGSGGAAANGGAVSITNGAGGTINTRGEFSHGILAQSIGGTGGSSGLSANLIVALQGKADRGGSGGRVEVTNQGSISTTGNYSRGIFAQSIGGGGGSGGASFGLVALGGSGSGGGSAGTVVVTNGATGVINTTGVQSDAIFAQSVGGSGGGGSTAGGLVAVGGSGAAAGNGGNVTVNNAGTITTTNVLARGVVAQSIGGGGGDGGSTGGIVAVGGTGGGGGAGGVVTVSNSGSITTGSSGATGIFAQSVGGGGGNGGSAFSVGVFAGVGIGGKGGDGGDGGVVTATLQGASGGNASVINTSGDRSVGLFAQSVGGGGGTGGGAVQVSVGFGAAVSVAIGGDGGKGGKGGDVTLASGGGVSVVETSGSDSTGIFLQSVGGGGGDGGYSVSVAASAGPVSGSLSVAIGGDAGNGGEGGKVTAGSFDGAGNVTSTGFNGSIVTDGDRSTGFMAQSIGGGGGNGGLAVSAALSASTGASASVGIGLGGSGGDGGQGGQVSVALGGDITTGKDFSTGMLVQSVGGGGGNGGGSIVGALSASGGAAAGISVSLGGSGGKGGLGGEVLTGTSGGQITTNGNFSSGIVAQSVGGGGGNGGYSASIAASAGSSAAASISVGLGGSGGDGGKGGTVRASFASNVTTSGIGSTGILTQSVGGGGGNGGLNVSGALAGSGGLAGGVAVGLGGSGGDGGIGGTVTASSSGVISTNGLGSAGFVAQSIGGGGGNGGFNISGALSGAGGGSGAITVGLGGTGGAGSVGGNVNATVTGSVTTNGEGSTGVLAQSIGGGGGNGGFNVAGSLSGAGLGSGAVSVGLGGSAGTGASAGNVDLKVRNNVTTLKDGSAGIISQSIGGGGGNGGFNISGALSGGGKGSGAVTVGLGGSGAAGGLGREAKVLSTGAVRTEGENSTGILVQSLGGGGGNGGFNISGSGSGGGVGSGAIAVGLGGSAGSGNHSGKVVGDVQGTVTTLKNGSSGVVAQSIGGGGGNGGFNISGSISGAGTGSGAVSVGLGGSGSGGGVGGEVDLDVTNTVVTMGTDATGILAQSVGGGGGNGGFNISASGSGAGTGSGVINVGLGGSGGAGGNAGLVNSKATGVISTDKDRSMAFVAQSIGGGGGNGGFNISAGASVAGTGSGAVNVGLGGSGSTGGMGGRVIAETGGNIFTKGDASGGVLAQSVGGGGGNGGFNISASLSGAGTGSGAVSVGLGGSGAGGGNGGVVELTVNNNIQTGGKNSTAAIAQSIGGGGGNGGFDVSATASAAGTGSGALSVSLGGSGGGAGNGANVTSNVTGNLITGSETASGANSGGLLVQSVGGGGGNGGFSVAAALSGAKTGSAAASISIGGTGGTGGSAGVVDSTLVGDVFTFGENGDGVMVQSIGGGGGNGGLSVSGTVSLGGTGAGALGVGIGGTGGGGGLSSKATNRVTGYVQTIGDNSTGILTQSLGGGGGNGGLNVTGTITGAKTGSGSIAVGIGGFGGDGGAGGEVVSRVTGGVVTTGNGSVGILSQSQGGGGGNGALNVTASLNISKENGGTLGVGVGGFGGGGGNAMSVDSQVRTTVDDNQIATTGANSSGIMALAIGGGGGNGGTNITGAVNLSGKNGAAIGVGVGGFGGGAGDGGAVKLDVSGNVVTQGNQSHGLVAQSIGGGGGNGGTNVTGTLAFTAGSGGGGTTAVAASIGVGGFGGGGGEGKDVDLDYTGTITAVPLKQGAGGLVLDEGGASHGILAQSLGGGGGNGGVNVSAGISYGGGKNGDGQALLVGVGGFGGAGGDAGNVDVKVLGGESVTAYGAGHSAIMAQSAGGGGGNGGVNVSGGIVSDSSLIVGVGGLGGNGGLGKNVTVDATTNVMTGAADSGDLNSAGIFAQSLGGGGGNGGLNISGGLSIEKEANVPSITVGVGGFGGAGNKSGVVTVTHVGSATTSGNWVHGIMAQSLAGGGGNGALNISGQVNFADSENSGGKKDLTIVAGIGGHGGKGADSGNVSVTSRGTISTVGDHARGIFAQSIGGGGGTGGMNVTGVFAKNSNPIAVGIGGFGSGGGDAGGVTVVRGDAVTAAGAITTDGQGAIGIEASSIGGGGGDAGMNFVVGISKAGGADDDATGDGGATDPGRKVPEHTGVDKDVLTNFNSVLDQLEGKTPADTETSTDAKKDSAYAVQIAIGGAGGEAGNGGTARVDNYGDITTQKADSHGIMAQSIGGGGGNASANVAVTFQEQGDKNKGFNLLLGGQPGDGGTGADVDVIHDGRVETFGKNSYGVLAQSIGGGGGNVGLDIAVLKSNGGQATVQLGRRGGEGGAAGNVTLSSAGVVMTHGDTSYGLLAQSIGNGGGNSSTTQISISESADDAKDTPARQATIAIGLEGGMGGSAGNVDVTAEGWVTTEGARSHAIFAQSVGGGGGNGGSASGTGTKTSNLALTLGGSGGEGGTGGDVTVTSDAQVRTNNADSVGILAQSIGGGGGTGGSAKGGGSTVKGGGIAVTVGGSGGVGMTSGEVSVTNSGVIITDGVNSYGVLAQSLGGGGGNAGATTNKIENKDPDGATQISVAIGGTGGEGAISKKVTVANTGGIGTNQAGSIGIFAQSIGGGGGNAATVTSQSVAGAGGGNNFSLALGGSGGEGAAAGDVFVSNLITADVDSGKIITLGDNSHGIMASSVGGGGGNGSNTISSAKEATLEADVIAKNSGSTQLALSIGGKGAKGGTGGEVSVTNGGSINTYGFKSHGIVAQSIGGGGGNGGLSTSGDLTPGVQVGKDPGRGTSSISIGGFGGEGNKGGKVTVTNSGAIEVNGNKSYGIYAQSIGGGGGDGGMAISASRDILENPKKLLEPSLVNIGVGGSGGSGGDSGDVLVEHSGSIISRGDDSYGIFAQSLSGGGGNVGTNISGPQWMAADLAISTIIGGRDGANGEVGTVTVNTTGDITMTGANSQAQFTQSIAGGGGNAEMFLDVSKQAGELGSGGFTLPDNGGLDPKVTAIIKAVVAIGTADDKKAAAKKVASSHVGDLVTLAKDSAASLTQSVGGGGGNSKSNLVVDTDARVDLELALGATNTSESSGGDVDQTRMGDVGTMGDQSQGVGVQSIGGGGGNLVVNVVTVPVPPAGSVEPGTSVTDPNGSGVDPADLPDVLPNAPVAAAAAPSAAGSEAQASLGAVGSVDNHGGNVNLNYTGDLVTMGDRSYGAVIQSIGGGGGQLNVSGLNELAIGLGGTGGTSGNGGSIALVNAGGIQTDGILAHGLVLQSVGGGGGLAFTDMDDGAIIRTLNTDNSGNGGAITLEQTGDVVVRGERAVGVLAQSVGGGGGIVDRVFSGSAGGSGSSGAITLNLDGNVVASGSQGIGVFAQSKAADGQGNIEITLAADKMVFAGAGGTGVHFSGGASNKLTNLGDIATTDGLGGSALLGEDGDEVVTSSGLFYGQFELGMGANSFTNKAGGEVIYGQNLGLGAAGNLFTNNAVIRPGDTGLAQRTDLTGSFAQSATGVNYSELDFDRTDRTVEGGEIDRMFLTGSAELGGELDLRLLNPQLVPSGDFQKTIFSTEQGAFDAGMFLTTAPSVVITYELNYPTANLAVVNYNVDFSPDGDFSQNLNEVGNYFNRIQAAGSTPELADTVIKLLFDPTIDDLRNSLSQIGPDIYGELQANMIRSSERFGHVLVDGGSMGVMDHGRYIWFNYESESSDHGDFLDYKKVFTSTQKYSFGIQQELKKDWIGGVGFSIEDHDTNGYGGRWNAEGHTRHAGVMLKHYRGANEFAGTLSYGKGFSEVTRRGEVTAPFLTEARANLETFSGMLRASHTFKTERAYIKPMAGVGFTHLNANGLSERGADALNLILEDHDEFHLWTRLGTEMGYNLHTFDSGLKLNVNAEAGYQYYLTEGDTQARARLQGGLDSVDPMKVDIGLYQSHAYGTLGLELLKDGDYSISLDYSTILDEDQHTDRWSFGVRYQF